MAGEARAVARDSRTSAHPVPLQDTSHAYLGFFSALTGMALSLAGGYLLTRFFFEITFAFDWVELLVITAGVVVLTVAIGWFNSREVIKTPPSQVLRKEG